MNPDKQVNYEEVRNARYFTEDALHVLPANSETLSFNLIKTTHVRAEREVSGCFFYALGIRSQHVDYSFPSYLSP